MRNAHEQKPSLPSLTMNDKFPLSMLLCLLADGRQLTLDEIDRILVYLLEKKAKMLTLPPGTLPPLPAQFATKTSTNYLNEKSSNGKLDLTTEKTFPTVIAEQIRQMITTSSNGVSDMRNISLDSIPNIVKTEQMLNSNQRDINGDYSQSLSRESHLSITNNGTLPTSFHSHPSTQPMTTTVNPFLSSAFPSFNPLNPALKPPPSTTHNSNPLTQASEYLYSLASSTNLYPLSINSTPNDAIYQTYSQLNALPLLTAATLNPQMLRPPPTSQPAQTKQET